MAPTEEDEHRIYLSAQHCEELFQRVLDALAKDDAQRKHYRLLRDFHQRYGLWVRSIGVFADQNVSLDRRLESFPTLRNLVLQLLKLVEKNLSHSFWFEQKPNLRASAGPGTSTSPEEPKLVEPVALSTSLAVDASLDSIREAVEKLHHIAINIRKSSTGSLASRVKAFTLKTDPSEIAEFERICLLFIKGRYDGIGDSLAKQLVSSITYRRLRLLYQREHQKKLETPRKSNISAPPPPLPIVPEPRELPEKPPEPAEEPPLQPKPVVVRTAPPPKGHEPSESSRPSTLDQSKYHRTSSRKNKEIPDNFTVTSISQGYSYPRPPKPDNDHDTSCRCKWCPRIIEVSDLRNLNWWKDHFKKDLEPYVCISEKCTEPAVYFKSYSAWRDHMDKSHGREWAKKVHNDLWYCDIDSDEYVEFSNADQLEKHIRKKHPDALNDEQIAKKVTRNVLQLDRKANYCPLCNQDVLALYALQSQSASVGGKEDSKRPKTRSPKKVQLPDIDGLSDSDGDIRSGNTLDNDDTDLTPADMKLVNYIKMSRHVAGHLKPLAFMSIRYLDEDTGSAKSEQAASGLLEQQSEAEQIRVLEDFPDANGVPEFEDMPFKQWLDKENGPTLGKADGPLSVRIPKNPPNDSQSSGYKSTRIVDDNLYWILRESRVRSHFDGTLRKFLPAGALTFGASNYMLSRALVLKELTIDQPSAKDEHLINFILEKATKLFAICAYIQFKSLRLKMAIRLFMKENFDDDKLPIESALSSASAETSGHKSISPDGPAIQGFLASLETKHSKQGRLQLWERNLAYDFYDAQWMFLAPVLQSDKKSHDFHERVILPFIGGDMITGEGYFNTVSKYEVHPDHFKDSSRDEDKGPYIFAVKRSKLYDESDRQKIAARWASQVAGLAKLDTLNQDHIVRFVTAFRRVTAHGLDHYLLFEWADGGNLLDFWTKAQNPSFTAPLVRDAIKQLFGLAQALSAAHNYGANGISHRHGHLKPTNILRFEDGSMIGKLKISGWDIDTDFGTPRYNAPEVETGLEPTFGGQTPRRRSRFQDIWAMGCITLEFIIWILYGPDDLQRFQKRSTWSNRAPFYEVDEVQGKKTAKVHRLAAQWMDHMEQDPACRVGTTALGDLLEVVRIGLLVVKLPRQMRTALPNAEPSTLIHTAATSEIPQIQITPAQFETPEPEPFPISPGPERFHAQKLCERLELILSEDENEEYWNTDAPRSPPLIGEL